MQVIGRIEDLQPGDLLVNDQPITASVLGTNLQPWLVPKTPIILLGYKRCDITSMNEPVWKFTFMANERPFEREWVDTVFIRNMYLVGSVQESECGDLNAQVF